MVEAAPRRPTLAQVAAQCGVAVSTASMALNHPATETRLDPETVRRVRAAAEQLGYRANSWAKVLRGEGSGLVGLVFPDVEAALNDFGATLVQLLSRRLASLGRDLVLVPVGARDTRLAQRIAGERLDACLVFNQIPPGTSEALALSRKPGVAVNAPSLDGSAQHGWIEVGFDDTAIVDTALNHLWDLGHRRIWFCMTPSILRQHGSGLRRQNAYTAWCVSHGIGPRIAANERPERCALSIRNDAERPTAVLCFADNIALSLLSGCRDAGLRVPEDLSVISINNQLPLAEFAYPTLSTIALPVQELATAAVNAIDHGVVGQAPHLLPGTLVVRRTTAALH